MNALPHMKVADATKRVVYERADLQTLYLPIGQMLQLNRVTEVNENQVVCELDVTGHWVFPLHFPADPIFPGSLLIEAAGQAVAVWAWHMGLRGRPRLTKVAAKFESPVGPLDQVVTLVATVRSRKFACFGTVELFVQERKVATVTPMLIILPEAAIAAHQPTLF